MKIKNKVYLTCLCLILTISYRSYSQVYPGFKVDGRYLYDRCGERVFLRGVNCPNIWFHHNGIPYYEEIGFTGANVVRIVWDTTGSPSDLDDAISNCIAEDMIPMVEIHDATGNWSRLQRCVNYWLREDIVSVIQTHEQYLLVNIANECGDYNVSPSDFRNGYTAAITAMRDSGIHVPLVIDGTDYGKNINILQSEGPDLIEADPDHNLLFSVHMWWAGIYGYTESNIVTEIAQSVSNNLPLIVGEFAQMHGSDTDTLNSSTAIAYKTIIRECEENGIGYIAWSWFGNSNPLWDMTTDGTFDNLYSWGLEVAIDNINGIQQTSVRPYSIVHDVCNPIPYVYPTGLEELTLDFSGNFTLYPNYPNPFSVSTDIRYDLTKDAHVKLSVYNSVGQELRSLVNEYNLPGEYFITFHPDGLSGGIYYLSIEVDGFTKSQKMVLLK